MSTQFETFVLVEIEQRVIERDEPTTTIERFIVRMIRAYTDKARGEDAAQLLRDVCPDREFNLIPVEHVD